MRMKLFMMTCVALALSSAGFLSALAQERLVQVHARFRYVAKFVCGAPPAEGDVARPIVGGRYATAIDVHNGHIDRSVTFAKKVVVTGFLFDVTAGPTPSQQPGPITPFRRADLEGNHGFEIDCVEIEAMVEAATGMNFSSGPGVGVGGGRYIKGFVVIESPTDQLDVTALYTMRSADGATNDGRSLDVEVIQPVRNVPPATVSAQ